jgi:HEAT repeat protein
MHDPHALTRLGAIDSLILIDKANIKESVPMLLDMVSKPYVLDVRFRAAEGLVKYAPEQAKSIVPWLSTELTDVNADIRLQAATLLMRIDPEQTLPVVRAVLPALHSPVPAVRAGIVRALGSLGSKAREAVPSLVGVLHDNVPAVRDEAAQALRAIDPRTAKRLGIE